jgi:hypothetical protein
MFSEHSTEHCAVAIGARIVAGQVCVGNITSEDNASRVPTDICWTRENVELICRCVVAVFSTSFDFSSRCIVGWKQISFKPGDASTKAFEFVLSTPFESPPNADELHFELDFQPVHMRIKNFYFVWSSLANYIK